MNNAEKVVFSRTLKTVDWNNSRIINKDIISEVKQLKYTSNKNLTLLGSGSILTQFADAGLVDEYQVLVDPVVLGEGTQLFRGLKEKLQLQLYDSKVYKNGNVLLRYHPK
jgi:dihydrofolate reductase